MLSLKKKVQVAGSATVVRGGVGKREINHYQKN
jgi:hypothetical protein